MKQALYEPIFPCYVVGDVPERLTFLLIADEARVVSPAMEVVDDWPRKAYVTREVKHRLHQRRFRYLVLSAYREQCAMCSLRHTTLLDAAHILPDRDERGNPEVPNGLSLCRIHHGAYDVDILGVDPDYRIHVRRDVLEEIDGDAAGTLRLRRSLDRGDVAIFVDTDGTLWVATSGGLAYRAGDRFQPVSVGTAVTVTGVDAGVLQPAGAMAIRRPAAARVTSFRRAALWFVRCPVAHHHNRPIENSCNGARASNTVGGLPPSVTPEMAA